MTAPDWLTLPVGALIAFAFTLGVVTGVVGRALWVESHPRASAVGHTDPVPTTPVRRRLLYVLAVFSVLLAATANVQLIGNSNADENRSKCAVEYNRVDGEARDARDAAGVTSTGSTLAFLLAIRDQTTNPQGDPETQLATFLTTIDAWIAALRSIQSTRTTHPNPDPDACLDGHFTDEDLPSPSAPPTTPPPTTPPPLPSPSPAATVAP